MTDRDRLIELLNEAEDICDGTFDCDECEYNPSDNNCRCELTADHLLANGVIVPPCKVGQTIYYADDFLGIVEKCKVYGFTFVNKKINLLVDNGELKFLTLTWHSTKEEAEQALKDMRKEDEGK